MSITQHRNGEAPVVGSHDLSEALESCMLADRARFAKRLATIDHKLDGKDKTSALQKLEQGIERSQRRVLARADHLPQPGFPAILPVVEQKQIIADAIRNHQVIIVCGETGSGKTTQLPKICLECRRGVNAMIGHTQPRRIAARSVAGRIAEELGSSVGEAVGYKIRFSDHVRENSYIKLMTDGILLNELQRDPLLWHYDTLILDEAHERSLNIDFLLGYLKRILPQRPDLKLIVTSATIDPQSFAEHFNDAPVIEVSGRSYPVEVRYRPLAGDDDEEDDDQLQGIIKAVEEILALGSGDILLFLPGQREILDTANGLGKRFGDRLECVPLFSRLSAEEQNRVFQPHQKRRVVLATNVAETSLTVPGIKYVIDTGTARISRYSVRSKVQRLPIEPIAQASAKQRMGRCGRTAPGVCIRLYAEDDLLSRPEFTAPELLRTNLAAVILQMHHLRLGEIERFPFLVPPDRRYINDGYKVLQELGAMDDERRLTRLGKRIARLPVDPKLARMILAGAEQGSLREVLVVASALATQDPRERPLERQQAADEKHREFRDEQSDFISLINLWDFIQQQRNELSRSGFRKLCKQRFLSWLRIREWQDVHRQLERMSTELDLRENQQPADYRCLHSALLTGLLSHAGFKQEDGSFLGARNRSFHIFPGSGLARKSPKWIVAAELTETTRLFARSVARVEPGWIERAAQHVITRSYFEPHWQTRASRVGAFEKISLYGLTLIPKRRVNYGPINPTESREIFIQAGLVEGRLRTRAKFLAHNRQLINRLEALEDKSRRRDILVADDVIYDFYATRVPDHVHSGTAFEKWYRDASHNNDKLLDLTEDLLRLDAGDGFTAEQYPDTLAFDSASLSLSYAFEPGQEHDGITLTVPVTLLGQVDAARCDWLVPGLLKQKIAALIKTLPKNLRKTFVPAPDYADKCVAQMTFDGRPLITAVNRELQRLTGVEVPRSAWRPENLPEYLCMRFQVIDTHNKVLASGRDLPQLQTELAERTNAHFDALPVHAHEQTNLTDWTFEPLASIDIRHQGVTLTGHPAIMDDGKSVSIRLLDTREKAAAATRAGIRRLFLLKLADKARYLEKKLPDLDKIGLLYQRIGNIAGLRTQLVETVFDRVLIEDQPPIADREAFQKRIQGRQQALVPHGNELSRLLLTILEAHHALRVNMSNAATNPELEAHLDSLIYDGFIGDTPMEWLKHYPRYLQATGQRLALFVQSPGKDERLELQIEPWIARYRALPVEDQNETRINFRWMLEEFRVSLFAQQLGTAMPVSTKRLEKQWEKIEGKSA